MESSLVGGLEWWGTFEATRIITVSGWMKEHITQLFKLPPEKVDVIPNGVDISKFLGDYKKALAEAKWALAADDLVVTAVGRMTSQKGFDYLLKAFPGFSNQNPRQGYC